MAQYQDPWSWVDQQKPSAPLAAQIQPSAPEQVSPLYVQPEQDPMEQQLQSMAMGKGVEAVGKGLDTGYKAYQAGQAASAMAPLSANAVIGSAAPAMSVAPVIATPATAALTGTAAASGAPLLAAAPAMSTAAGAALGAGGTAAAAPLATGAAMAGGEAALAALGPVGWAIGAGLLAKKLGIF
jgi:hypothetical protein